ncbi:MAG: hypothetical protein JRI80_17380 [Deltaproteobacteria bacterium]|nr:hypothetical protein [Deltaproteobacteria bacterium]
MGTLDLIEVDKIPHQVTSKVLIDIATDHSTDKVREMLEILRWHLISISDLEHFLNEFMCFIKLVRNKFDQPLQDGVVTGFIKTFGIEGIPRPKKVWQISI